MTLKHENDLLNMQLVVGDYAAAVTIYFVVAAVSQALESPKQTLFRDSKNG